ncbi:hypothetical protein EZV62_021245 [Acer yangbiense]|uniref:Uncharacterized protein n=1 Tax=Acer yangbiense TaxID=1000413 RepID=A0A5C7H782_9ROSI|nr:hypothetical protein EZV62_021245 [Acer yangbiense]
MAIRDFRRTLKPKGEKPVIEKFDFTRVTPLQVLRPAYMTMSDMASIVNDVATRYDAVGYVSGYSADSKQWKRKNSKNADSRQWERENSKNLRNKVFFENFFKDLNAKGGLSRKLFTISNEKNSTKYAEPSLAKFHQLSSVDCFLDSYIEYGMADRFTFECELVKYGITDSSILQKQLDFLIKSHLDCLAAAKFTLGCAEKVFTGRDPVGNQQIKEVSGAFSQI